MGRVRERKRETRLPTYGFQLPGLSDKNSPLISTKKSNKIKQYKVIPRAVLSAVEKYDARFLS